MRNRTKTPRESSDTARLDSRYRTLEILDKQPRPDHIFAAAETANTSEGRPWDPEDEDQHLRGIPLIGVLGGEIKNTRPDTSWIIDPPAHL